MTQCKAKSKRTGNRCQRPSRIGQQVCHQHGGGSPQAQRKAAERIAFADALARDDRRSPAAILADVGHQADYLWRQAQASVLAGEVTPELLELGEMAGRWAKTNLDAGTTERQTRVVESQAAGLLQVLSRIWERLELTPVQRDLVSVVVPEEMRRQHELEAGQHG